MVPTRFLSNEEENTPLAWFKRRIIVRFIRIGAVGLIILLAWLFNDYDGGYFKLPLGPWIDFLIDWLIDNFSVVFRIIKVTISFVLNNFQKFLLWLPWWSVVMLVMLSTWWVAGFRIAIFSAVGMYFILILGLWDLSMSTLSLMITSVFISNILGIPLGILAARSNFVESLFRPILDAMQVMPSFVYLIPALMFFGIGKVPAVMACVIYGLPPVVRLTNLGIRQVPAELVEAAHAFGSTRNQLLIKVQLPLALPSIMAGVNQTIMMNLGMAVLASMIAAGGLGGEVLMALGQIDIGRGFVAGLCIIILAMILDRVTQVLGRRKKSKDRRIIKQTEE